MGAIRPAGGPKEIPPNPEKMRKTAKKSSHERLPDLREIKGLAKAYKWAKGPVEKPNKFLATAVQKAAHHQR